MNPVLLRIGDTHVSFWPREVFANGWQPYDQPHPGAYLPCSFEQCERHDVGDGAAILVYRGMPAPARRASEPSDADAEPCRVGKCDDPGRFALTFRDDGSTHYYCRAHYREIGSRLDWSRAVYLGPDEDAPKVAEKETR